MKLQEKHIIKAGGTYYVDKHKTQWIELILKDKRSKLWFYNCGSCFNVYVQALTSHDETLVQFTTIKSWLKFKLLLFVFK